MATATEPGPSRPDSPAGGVLYFSAPNVRYQTGFTGSNGQAWVESGYKVLFTDGRYETQAAEQAEVDEVVIYERLSDALNTFFAQRAPAAIRYEAPGLTVDTWHKLAEKIELDAWEPASDDEVNCRVGKGPGELDDIRTAISIAEASYNAIVPLIKPGAVEREISLALEWEIRQRGSERIPFEFIVASGPRSALPHGTASDRVLEAGDALTIDFGAEHNGYFSDMTVAGSVGHTNPWIEEIAGVLAEAQQAAFAAVAAGVAVADVDRAARAIVEAAGYGDAFKHSLGHGVGLDVHEAPRLSQLSAEILQHNSVITIEPGIYVEGKGGARLEDMVLVTRDGCELLTTIPKKHIVWT